MLYKGLYQIILPHHGTGATEGTLRERSLNKTLASQTACAESNIQNQRVVFMQSETYEIYFPAVSIVIS